MKPRIAFMAVAIGAASLTLAAAAFAQKMIPPQMPGQPAQMVFFVANSPSPNRVGIFMARRSNGIATLYYCSSPVDATSKDPGGCREIKGFPTQ